MEQLFQLLPTLRSYPDSKMIHYQVRWAGSPVFMNFYVKLKTVFTSSGNLLDLLTTTLIFF